MRALMISYVMSLGVEGGGVWRAIAVASLALSGFLLKRYWGGLGQYPRRLRLLIVSLRAAALLLLICALAGVRVGYESISTGRVLVRSAMDESAAATADEESRRVMESALERTVAALRSRGFEAVRETPASGAFVAEHDEGFAAAVLLTDGALSQTEARREVERTRARAGGASVYVLTELEKRPGPSVALEGVQVLGQPVRGVPLTLRCTVHGRGMSGHESLLTVSDSAKVQSSSRVNWRADDEWQSVTLEVVPKVAGWAEYLARIEAAGGEDQDVLTRAVAFYVEERRLRVLFFEGEPTWEAKFIRRALEQTGLFELDYFAQVSRAAVAGSTAQAETENQNGPTRAGEGSEAAREGAATSPEARLHAALANAASLSSYDAVIVGATPNALLSAAEAARLVSWVERRGGGLIITGGNSFAGSIAAPNGRLYALMPTDVEARGLVSETQQTGRGTPLEAEKSVGVRALVPTEAGAVGPLYGYLSASEGAVTAALSGQGFSLRGVRAGTLVLASAGHAGAAATASDAAAAEPLIAAMRYGAGRVTVFAPADSWRIRTSASGAQDDVAGPFGALWQGLVLWAAEGARPQVEIVLDAESPAVGQSVTAELRVRDRSFAPLKLDRVKASLQPLAEGAGDGAATGAAQELLFMPDMNDPTIWRARFNPSARGQFSVQADYLSGQETGSTEKLFAVVARSRKEWGAARDTLMRVARERDGELFALDQMSALLERLSISRRAAEKVERTVELRTYWPLAFILPLLLCAEWLARRRAEAGRE